MTVITIYDADKVIADADPIARDRVVGPHVLLRHPNSTIAASVTGTMADGALKLWVINGGWNALLWTDGTFQPLTGEGANTYPVEVVWQGKRPPALDDSDALVIAIAREIVRGDTGANRQDITGVAMPIGLMRACVDSLMDVGQDTLAARIVDAAKGAIPEPDAPSVRSIVITPAQLANVCKVMAGGFDPDVRDTVLEAVAGPLVAESLRHNMPAAFGPSTMTPSDWDTVAAIVRSDMPAAHRHAAVAAVADTMVADQIVPLAS